MSIETVMSKLAIVGVEEFQESEIDYLGEENDILTMPSESKLHNWESLEDCQQFLK